MVVVETMSKPTLKVSVSSDSTSEEESESQSDEEIVQEPILDEAEADNEDNESIDEPPEEDSMLVTNEGWADSVAKILGSTKPKNKKTLVLSRAKKHSEVIKKKDEKPAFEVIGEEKEEKSQSEIKKEESTSEPPVKKPKIEKPSIRVKPNILEKDRERLLTKIATKGVVQLFNAVRNQQKSLEKDMNRTDLSEAKKEKILKKFDKRAFLDTLMGQTKSIVVDEHTKSLKDEVKDEHDAPKWSALRDDFMMGAKMKDWDKELEDD
ncbi:RRP15-like protein [Plodia interpunctella]|uniref:RRP15-like protein n=1 Tax=Plodia interpunctella TaxID=58824 RepID=UPI002368382C|nr:RRP15-like protein [Plodia interpunctella]